MKNKRKLSIFAIIMSVMMMITSIGVYAGSIREEVPLVGWMGYAYAWIAGDGLTAEAETEGASAMNDIAYTGIYGAGPYPYSAQGWNYAQVSAAEAAFTFAESTHVWTGIHRTLQVFP